MTRALCLVALVLLVAAPSLAFADIELEVEDMIGSHNIGGAAIVIRGCSAASQGVAVEGWDTDGEWIDLRLELTTAACFTNSVRSAGMPGGTRTFAVYFKLDSNTTVSSDTLTTVEGEGIT
jgi:hypothetical protein